MNLDSVAALYGALMLAMLILAPLAIAGVALINTGLGRSRSAAQAFLGSLTILAVAAIVFTLVGDGLAGSLGGISLVAAVGGKNWAWANLGPFGLHGLGTAPVAMQVATVLELLSAAFAALIPWGSGADRWRLAAACAAAVVTTAITFPFAAHWIWSGGWLAQLGKNFGLGGGFLDPGGASVHLLGGLSALAITWIVGPRQGKFPKQGLSTAIPGHNAVYVLFGSFLALLGWTAWNVAGAIVWRSASLSTLAVIIINTLLCSSGAILATVTVTRLRFGKPDASLCANGWLAGLVASSACAAIVAPGAALFIGIVTGIMTPLLVEFLELALSIDDPSGAIAVHGAAALWGLFAVGVFAPGKGQVLAQLVGIAALIGVLFPLVYLLFKLLNRVVPFRADAEGERIGMDLHELGGGAYPEFVIHRDDSYR